MSEYLGSMLDSMNESQKEAVTTTEAWSVLPRARGSARRVLFSVLELGGRKEDLTLPASDQK